MNGYSYLYAGWRAKRFKIERALPDNKFYLKRFWRVLWMVGVTLLIGLLLSFEGTAPIH